MSLPVAGGCGDDDVPPPEATRLRAVHAAPDAPAVDVYIRGQDIASFENLAYGEAGAPIAVDPGTYVIDLRLAGDDPATEPILSSEPITVNLNEQVTAIVAGLIEGPPEDTIRVLAVPEQFAAVAANEARVRFVHAGIDLPPVAIDIGDDGTFEIEGLDLFGASDAAGIAIPAREGIRVAVYTDAEPRELITVFTVPALAERERALMIVAGLAGALPREPRGIRILAVDRDARIDFFAQDPSISMVNALPDSPAVDFQANGRTIASDVGFGHISSPAFVGRGEFTLDMFQAGETTAPIASGTTAELVQGERYLVVAGGSPGPAPGMAPFELITVVDEFDPTLADSQIQFVNVTADMPSLDLGIVENGVMVQPPMASGLGFGESSAIVRVPEAVERIVVGVAPTGTVPAPTSFIVDTPPGLRAYAIAAGSVAPAPGQQPVILIFIDVTAFPWIGQISPTF